MAASFEGVSAAASALGWSSDGRSAAECARTHSHTERKARAARRGGDEDKERSREREEAETLE